MTMHRYLNQLRYYAEHNPKTSTAILTLGTALSCVAIVGFIELKDRIDYMKKGGRAASDDTNVSLEEAQLAAMLENAKKSTWQENLRNASDAQDRFMLPNNEDDGNGTTPEYVKKIHDRSQEILRDEERKREETKNFSSSRFWK